MNAEKAPFFIQKLMVRVLPTIIAFHQGVAMDERVIGFQDLTQDLEPGRESEFPTSAVRKFDEIGFTLIDAIARSKTREHWSD